MTLRQCHFSHPHEFFGRVLTEESRIRLRDLKTSGVDVALIVSNGLSSTAVERRGIALLQTILEGLRLRQISWLHRRLIGGLRGGFY